MYKIFLKRFFDFVISVFALVLLSPLLILLTILGWIFMHGNPFFVQERPGRNEKVFKLIKFRSMSNKRDATGNLLPDAMRLGKYGKFLRASSLDEIPELINIFKGDMALVGPRPLLVKYLPYYSDEERHRHDVRPGLTGLAQINGRNASSWDKRLKLDVEYVNSVSFQGDIKILFTTIWKVLKREGISSETSVTKEDFISFCKENRKWE